METLTIISAILTVLLGYFAWNVQRLTRAISDLQKEFNKFLVSSAGSAVLCKAKHDKIEDRLQNHEGRIMKLEDPATKKKPKRR